MYVIAPPVAAKYFLTNCKLQIECWNLERKSNNDKKRIIKRLYIFLTTSGTMHSPCLTSRGQWRLRNQLLPHCDKEEQQQKRGKKHLRTSASSHVQNDYIHKVLHISRASLSFSNESVSNHVQSFVLKLSVESGLNELLLPLDNYSEGTK